jgi:hypothetical protein
LPYGGGFFPHRNYTTENSPPSIIQFSFTLPLEVVGPGGNLSMMLYSNPTISARRQLERVLVGSNGNGGIQLQPDDGGARLSAEGRLLAATAERAQSLTALDFKLCGIRIRNISAFVFGLFTLFS